VQWWNAKGVLALGAALVLGGCVDPMAGDEAGSTTEAFDATSDTGPIEPLDEDSSSSTVAPACTAAEWVDELPHAIAWHETTSSGETELLVHVQSYPVSCAQADSSVSHGSRIRVRVPDGVVAPTLVDLRDADAAALMAPGAPGNDGSVFTIAFLRGELAIEEIDDTHIRASIADTVVPFTGCFEAPICD
jgi:hypothetical protein